MAKTAMAIFVVGVPAQGAPTTTLVVPMKVEDNATLGPIQDAAYQAIARVVLSRLASIGGPKEWYQKMRTQDLEGFVAGGGYVINAKAGSVVATVPGTDGVLQREGDEAAKRQLDHMLQQAKAELTRRSQ